jgi:hypothetical protein
MLTHLPGQPMFVLRQRSPSLPSLRQANLTRWPKQSSRIHSGSSKHSSSSIVTPLIQSAPCSTSMVLLLSSTIFWSMRRCESSLAPPRPSAVPTTLFASPTWAISSTTSVPSVSPLKNLELTLLPLFLKERWLSMAYRPLRLILSFWRHLLVDSLETNVSIGTRSSSPLSTSIALELSLWLALSCLATQPLTRCTSVTISRQAA